MVKLKISGAHAALGNLAKSCGVSLSGYPVRSHESENGIFVDFVGFIFGTEKNENNFIKTLSKKPWVKYVEKEGNFVLGRMVEGKQHSPVYSSGIVHIEPVIITEQGVETWTMGSWKKEVLISFIKSVESSGEVEILSIGQKKITNFTMMSISPNLSLKQRLVMSLAIKEGYYDYPRKITIEQLGNKLNISYSTLQAHLRKAENKFIPFCFKQFYS